MSPRTLGMVLLLSASALALAGTWLMVLMPAVSDLNAAQMSAEQTLTYTSAASAGLVGEPFAAEVRETAQRLARDEATLRGWIAHQSAEIDQFSPRLGGAAPEAAAFRSACEFDADELRRELSTASGREPPRPGSWPLYLPDFADLEAHGDAARMRREQQRMNLQRAFLLAAARARALPMAPMEFLSVAPSADSLWDTMEIHLHLAVDASGLAALARVLTAPGLPLRLRLSRFEFAPPTSDTQAAALVRGTTTPLVSVEARVLLESLPAAAAAEEAGK